MQQLLIKAILEIPRDPFYALLFNLLVGRISKLLYLLAPEIIAPANISRPAGVTWNLYEFIVPKFTMNACSPI